MQRANRKEKKAATAHVGLHKENEQDEPLEVDLDVQLTCDCGATTTARTEICKESDWVPMMCAACAATYRVTVQTALSFTATAVKESPSVL